MYQDKKIKLIVAGGRDFTDQQLANQWLDFLLQNYDKEDIVIVCGKARGADTLGEVWAINNGVDVWEFIPDWDGLGKKAGHVRNREMGNVGSHLLAFWDKSSKGTKGMIEYAEKKGLVVKVVNY